MRTSVKIGGIKILLLLSIMLMSVLSCKSGSSSGDTEAIREAASLERLALLREDEDFEDDESEEDEDFEEDDEAEDDGDLAGFSCDDDPVEIGQGAINIASTVIQGTANIDKLQGFTGDDIISGGGGGGEGYVLSSGTDIIVDFNPAEDLLITNDFGPMGKYEEIGIQTISSLSDLQALSTETVIDGQPALVIDVDGDLGNSTTTLLGVSLNQLNDFNVTSTFEEDEEDREIGAFTHLPDISFVATDGSTLTVPAHSLAEHPRLPTLEEGTAEAYDTLLCALTYGEADTLFGEEEEEDVDEEEDEEEDDDDEDEEDEDYDEDEEEDEGDDDEEDDDEDEDEEEGDED